MTGTLLRVYGPGGPYRPVSDCARLFGERTGTVVEVVKGEPEKLAARIAADGDLHYTGAPSMMNEFIAAHPGVIDAASVVDVQVRRVGILVRTGNPRGIATPADLARPGLRLLDVALESMAELRGDAAGAGANIARTVTTGEQGLAAWKADPSLDAWVTYKSWHRAAPEESAFVPIETPQALRATPAGLVHAGANRELAARFLDFLGSPEARAIFVHYGWE